MRYLIKPDPYTDEFVLFDSEHGLPVSPPLNRSDMYDLMVDERLQDVREDVGNELRATDELAREFLGGTELLSNTPGGALTDGYYPVASMGEVARILDEIEDAFSLDDAKHLVAQLAALRTATPPAG